MSEEVKTLAATVVEQQKQIADLLNVIKVMPGVQNPVEVTVAPPQPNVDEVKADKVQKLAVCMHKSHRVKPFKFDQDISVFLKRFKE